MLFWRIVIFETIVNLKQKLHTLANITSIDRVYGCRNGIWNDPIHLVILSAYSSFYLNVKDYKTENKMHIDIEHEQDNMAVALISTLLLTQSGSRWELSWQHILSAMMSEILPVLFVFG